MPLQISPLLDADIEPAIVLDFTSFREDPVHIAIFPNGPSPTTVAWNAAMDRKDLAEDLTVSPMKVTDTETGEMIAYGRWVFLPQREEKDLELEDFPLPDDANQELGKKMIMEGIRRRHAIMGTQPYAYLAILVTAAGHRKRGAGSMLLDWGLQIADEQHIPSYLEATPAGAGLYKSFGFEEKEKLFINLRPWTSYDRSHLCMVRPAR